MRRLLALLLVVSGCSSTEEKPAAATDSALDTALDTETAPLCTSTSDCASREIAETICKSSSDCKVCDQTTDPSGTVVQWSALSGAGCTCPAVEHRADAGAD